jgi:hypothetical protein
MEQGSMEHLQPFLHVLLLKVIAEIRHQTSHANCQAKGHENGWTANDGSGAVTFNTIARSV